MTKTTLKTSLERLFSEGVTRYPLMDLARRMHLLGSDTRLKMLALLEEKEMHVGELTEAIPGVGTSGISQHLAKLHMAGLVEKRRSAQNIYYKGTGDAVVLVALALLQKSVE
jgi:DNA-binding transcriptional ArsR family regulator